MFWRTVLTVALVAFFFSASGHPIPWQNLVLASVSLLLVQWCLKSLGVLFGPRYLVKEDEVIAALRAAQGWLTPAEIASRIEAARYDAYASHHKRMLRAAEIREQFYPVPAAIMIAIRRLRSADRLEEQPGMRYRLRSDRLWG